jgi:hypothetical protein
MNCCTSLEQKIYDFTRRQAGSPRVWRHDAVRSRIDGKYALRLEPTDSGFGHTVFSYIATPLGAMIQKRASWLVILFLGELLTATAMGVFETEIAKAVVLALFIPLIISSGGNSGAASTQKWKSFRSQESFAS